MSIYVLLTVPLFSMSVSCESLWSLRLCERSLPTWGPEDIPCFGRFGDYYPNSLNLGGLLLPLPPSNTWTFIYPLYSINLII